MTIRPPEPLTPYSYMRADGRVGVVPGESGRLWRVYVDPEARTVGFDAMPIVLPPPREAHEPPFADLSGSHDLSRVLLWTDRLRVVDFATGETVRDADPRPLEMRAVCLSPSGRHVIGLDESQGWTLEVDGERGWEVTYEFHDAGEERQFLDHVDQVVAIPVLTAATDAGGGAGEDGGTVDEDGRKVDEFGFEIYERAEFWVVAACYGEALVQRAVEWTPGGIDAVPGERRWLGKHMVYDPTMIHGPPGPRHVFVYHGYGSGVVALDLEAGTELPFPTPAGVSYSYVRDVVPCGMAPLASVSTRDGRRLWHVEEGRVTPVDGDFLGVMAVYPGTLLCTTTEGALRFVDLP
ncbi:MAG TPA: hypothetical protein VHG91_14950 [Longimicrobium sp.]|nr:hypothetical protein [Longimicrobium sp.]